jgi:hypothetical protein
MSIAPAVSETPTESVAVAREGAANSVEPGEFSRFAEIDPLTGVESFLPLQFLRAFVDPPCRRII